MKTSSLSPAIQRKCQRYNCPQKDGPLSKCYQWWNICGSGQYIFNKRISLSRKILTLENMIHGFQKNIKSTLTLILDCMQDIFFQLHPSLVFFFLTNNVSECQCNISYTFKMKFEVATLFFETSVYFCNLSPLAQYGRHIHNRCFINNL